MTTDDFILNKAYAALMLVQLSPQIADFMRQNDPKAFQQINDAARVILDTGKVNMNEFHRQRYLKEDN